ncbi:MAG: hypothetical protein WCG36_09715, partial [bacterium]
RLLHTAYVFRSPNFALRESPALTATDLGQVWPAAIAKTGPAGFFAGTRPDAGSVSGADCFLAGGELFDEGAENPSADNIGNCRTEDAYRLLCQMRFVTLGADYAGAYGGIANNLLCTRGGRVRARRCRNRPPHGH